VFAFVYNDCGYEILELKLKNAHAFMPMTLAKRRHTWHNNTVQLHTIYS